MGLVDNIGDAVSNTANALLSTLTDPFKKPHALRPPDFPGGFQITEIINGHEQASPAMSLLGDMLPMVPFEFGGEQKIVKDYYPGNAEPVMQVLGPREKDVTIHGRFKAKHYKDPKFIKLPEVLQEQADSLRIRGNLLKITLGEWKRYGFLEDSHFRLFQLVRIEYELKFSIVGFTAPMNCKIVGASKDVPFNYNSDLISAALAFQLTRTLIPKGFPGGLASLISGLISDVATFTNIVTNFVSTAIQTASDIAGAANRALGLIANARASLSRFNRQIRSISFGINSLGTSISSLNAGIGNISNASNLSQSHSNALLVASAYTNAHFILSVRSQSNNLLDLLTKLETQIRAIASTQPLARYSVHHGDTLQKIAFKFYNNSDSWKVIYDHNKLTSTDLTGTGILEIPKQ